MSLQLRHQTPGNIEAEPSGPDAGTTVPTANAHPGTGPAGGPTLDGDGGDPPVEPVVSWRPRLLAWSLLAARPTGIYLGARLVVLVAVWTASRINPPVSLGSALTGWDGGWYLEVANRGYPHSTRSPR